MEYLTLHELAHQFNKPERQVRYRFRELMKEGKLTEGDDFTKDDFVDEFHFAYKINPLRFMDEAKLVLDQRAFNNIVSKTKELGSQPASKEEVFDNNENGQPKPVGSEEDDGGYHNGSKDSESPSNSDIKPTQPATKSAINQEGVVDNNLSLDYIETLKEQMRVKDSQIESYKEQLDNQADLNRRAIGE